MKTNDSSDTLYLLSFFVAVIAVGTVLLWLPFSWVGGSAGAAGGGPRSFIDSFFVATSAVCVTGLSTVNVADFTRFGQIVILALIQVGGLGIISFTSLLLILPGHRLPFRRLRTIRGFSVDLVEYDPARIVRNIVAFTLTIELAGAAALFPVFSRAGAADPFFASVFHSVSAFCNAGFSLFPTNMEAYRGNPLMLGILSFLIVAGGIGFIVLQDIERRIRGKRKSLSYHSKLILSATAVLILGGAAAFWLLERNGAMSGMGPIDGAANALFQAITPRTAGFNALPQTALGQPSKVLTIILMFIGGSPGSIAGGIKVSTAFIVLLVMLKRPNERGDIDAFGRRYSAETTGTAVTYFLKAGLLLVAAAAALSLSEGSRNAEFGHIVFESVSAFGTVGLSLGITPSLSAAGKLIIIATMFAGRVGLIALSFPRRDWKSVHAVYPEASVLIG